MKKGGDPDEGNAFATFSGVLPAEFAESCCRHEDGALDLGAVLRWFAKPVGQLKRSLRIGRESVATLGETEESVYQTSALSPLLKSDLLREYTHARARGESRDAVEAKFAADPRLGLERFRKGLARELCDGFEAVEQCAESAAKELVEAGAVRSALTAEWMQSGETIRMHFGDVWVLPEKLVLLRKRTKLPESGKNNAATADVLESASLLAALRKGVLRAAPEGDGAADPVLLNEILGQLGAAAAEASPKTPGPFVELVIVALDSGTCTKDVFSLKFGAKNKPDEWRTAPPEALIEALVDAFLAVRRVPALHVFDAYVKADTPSELTEAARLLASLIPELTPEQAAELSKAAQKRFTALYKALLARRSMAQARSDALATLRELESSARNLVGVPS